nr:YdcF family protein [Roseibacterium persicicum]
MPRGDAIVCLGAGVNAAGVIDAASRARAGACAALARAGAAPVVVFTGGAAAPGAPSAAAGMAAVARAAGVAEASVLLEEDAHSTLQNALNTRPRLPEGARVILVTEAFHLPRAWASFRAMGVEVAALYPALRLRAGRDGTPDWTMLLRESVALWFNAGRYAAWRVGGALGIEDSRRGDWLH